MSFGVAFALPAYIKPLTGGLDPFAQYGATLDLSFTGSQYSIWQSDVGMVAKTFSNIITFTRASTGTYFDSTGVLQSAAVDVPRFDYDPTTLAQLGFLVEESRTNSIRNSTGVGVIAGSPGTMPTNWEGSTGTTNGVTRTVVGTGTENGIAYVDVTYAGTAIASGSITISEELNTQTVATAGQIWTVTNFLKLVAGSFANTASRNFFLNSYTALGGFVSGAISTSNNFPAAGPTTAALNTQRYFFTGTLSGATTTRVGTGLFFSFNAGAVIDFTLRIGLPQLELGSGPSSVIPTSTIEVTRETDLQKISTLSPWYNPSEGTIFAQSIVSSINAGNTNTGVASFDDNTSNNRIQLRHTSPSNNLTNVVVTSGVLQTTGVASLANTWPFGVMRKAVFAFKANDFRGALSGTLTAADPTGTIPTVTQLQLGNGLAINVLSGYLQRITYYPRRLTDAELQTLTT